MQIHLKTVVCVCVVYVMLTMSQMTLDYQYIDPGPDDPASSKNLYFALNASSLQFLCVEQIVARKCCSFMHLKSDFFLYFATFLCLFFSLFS